MDIERHHATADRLDIRHVPTLILFENGEERFRLVEVVKRSRIDEALREAGVT